MLLGSFRKGRSECPAPSSSVPRSLSSSPSSVTAFLVSSAIPATRRVDLQPSERPGGFVESNRRSRSSADDYASAWGSLYPGHKGVARQTSTSTASCRRPVELDARLDRRAPRRRPEAPPSRVSRAGGRQGWSLSDSTSRTRSARRKTSSSIRSTRCRPAIGVDVDPDAEPLPALPLMTPASARQLDASYD